MRSLVIGAAVLLLAVAGCGDDGGTGKSGQTAKSKPPSWPAPKDPLQRAVAAGLEPEVKEFLKNHVHSHLDVFVDGKPVKVPAAIGINIDDPDVHKFIDPGGVSYGGIKRCHQPCISPLHTHDASGIIHTESKTSEPNTLGEFFTEWGVELSDSCVGDYCDSKIAFYIDGEPFKGNPREIALTDLKEIAIVIGTPPRAIPRTANFAAA